MTTDADQLVMQALGSLISEERLGRPGDALSIALRAGDEETGRAADHLIDACAAALLCGEPKGALRILDLAERRGPVEGRIDAVLRMWAWQLDVNRYPGDVGAELQDAPPPDLRPGAEPDLLTLLEHVVAYGPTGLSTPRTLIEGMLRQGNGIGAQQIAGQAMRWLDQLAGRLGMVSPGSFLWTRLAAADLGYRLGMPDADGIVTGVREEAQRLGLPTTTALAHLLKGDQLVTPGSSPECLGLVLAPLPRSTPPVPAPDPQSALAWYDAARDTLGATDAPRLHAAIHLRRGMVLGLASPVEHDRRRDELRQAVTLYTEAGDRMGAHLAAAHLLLADLDAGAIQAHAVDLGGGWHQPEAGPVADALRWAADDGSTSWCVGIGRLFERAAGALAARGEVAKARVAYLAGLPLLRLNPGLPADSIITGLADLDTKSNLANRAIVRLERIAITPKGPGDWAVAERVEAAWVRLNAYRARSRGAAAEYAARAMLRMRAELAEFMPADPDREAPDLADLLERATAGSGQDGVDLAKLTASVDELSGMFAAGMAGAAAELVSTIDVLAPLARAGHAQRTGRGGDAAGWFADAIAKAHAPAAPEYLLPLAYVAADRLEEARTALRRLVDADALPDQFTLTLALRARDYELARQAADRIAGNGGASEWGDLLSRSELLRAEGRLVEAATEAERALAGFELVVSPLLRDPDRLAACDQPDVAALYLILAMLRHRLGEDGASLDAFERVRSLAWGAPLETTAESALLRTWQRLAAEWETAADRALVGIDRDEGGLSQESVDELDRADGALAIAERDLERADPGVLLRRSAPAPQASADLRGRLDDETVVLEYGAMGDDLMAWAVTSTGVRAVHHELSYRRLASMVRTFHRSCAGGRADPGEAFSDLLLAPFAKQLATHRRVVLVPFGPLNLLPFHALSIDGIPLAVSHVVSYAPTGASVGRAGALDQPIQADAPLVVGDPAFSESAHPGLRRLEGARVEAEAVSAALQIPSDRVLVDGDAAESKVIARIAGADLIHLATHGHLDELAPFASSLVLAGSDELTVADLVGLRLDTQLAVLSGCDTGRGWATLGGDVVGLTRSLLRSGVRQAVVSLWPVDDRVAPVVMDAFARNLAAGTPPAEALALAQRGLRDLSADGLEAAYLALGGTADAGDGARRRSLADLALDPELRDDEPLPEPLDGSAERYWAPFVLVGS